MNLKNGKTKTKTVYIIQDRNTGWYVSNRTFGEGGVLNHLTFTFRKDLADQFSDNEVNRNVMESIKDTPFDLKVIKLTKTIIEFENEEEI